MSDTTNAAEARRPSVISGPSELAVAAGRLTSPAACAAVRSRTWSPIATPQRGAVPSVLNTPSARFCTGKSVPGVFAEATQLFRAGSWVASRWAMDAPCVPERRRSCAC